MFRRRILGLASVCLLLADIAPAAPPQTIVQQSFGANSPNVVNINQSATQAQVGAVIRDLEKQTDRRIANIGKLIATGSTEEALRGLRAELQRGRDDIARTAALHSAIAQLSLLTYRFPEALKHSLLATTLVPENCRYLASAALIQVGAGRIWDGWNLVSREGGSWEHCSSHGRLIDQGILLFVRSIAWANRHDRDRATEAMLAADTRFSRIQRGHSGDDFFNMAVTCSHHQLAKTWSPEDEDLGRRTMNRCRAAAAHAQRGSPASNALVDQWTDRGLPSVRQLSERIDAWRTFPADPSIGVDRIERAVLLSDLHRLRGFAKLWRNADPKGALADYDSAFEILSAVQDSVRPGVLVAMAELGVKAIHLQEVTGAVGEVTSARLRSWIRTRIPLLHGESVQSCSAVTAVYGMSLRLDMPESGAIRTALEGCRELLGSESLVAKELYARAAAYDYEAAFKVRDWRSALQAIDRMLIAKSDALAFPRVHTDGESLADVQSARAWLLLQLSRPEQALDAATAALEANKVVGSHDVAVNANVNAAFAAATISSDAGQTQAFINAAHVAAEKNEKRSVKHECWTIYRKLSVYQAEAIIDVMQQANSRALQALDTLSIMSRQYTGCSDFRFPGEQGPSNTDALVAAIIYDAVTTTPMLRIAIEEADGDNLALAIYTEAADKLRKYGLPVQFYLPTGTALAQQIDLRKTQQQVLH